MTLNIKPKYNSIEEWRAIPGFEGYEASSHGRIRSWLTQGLWKPTGKPYIKKILVFKHSGYEYVGIRKPNKKCYPTYVHRLVCLAFNGERPAGYQCSHLDGNRFNNSPGNLAWETPLKNAGHKKEHGTQYHGEQHGASKLTEAQVKEIRDLHAAHLKHPRLSRKSCACSLPSIGRKYGISAMQVKRLCDKTSWAWLE